MANMVLFSAIQGRVLDNGKAVAGAQIDRSWKWGWNDQAGADRTSTAADGSFALPAVVRSSWLGSLLPHEPFIDQDITIQHGGKVYMVWAYSKRSYKDNSENEGRPLRVTCRLESKPARHSKVFGICEFD